MLKKEKWTVVSEYVKGSLDSININKEILKE